MLISCWVLCPSFGLKQGKSPWLDASMNPFIYQR
jgi:hypothetical protein